MEFVYPLKFPGVNGIAIPGLEPGDTYDIVLTQNTKTVSLNAKPTSQSTLKVTLADNPHLKKKE